MSEEVEKRYYSVAEIVAKYGISRYDFYRLVKTYDIPVLHKPKTRIGVHKEHLLIKAIEINNKINEKKSKIESYLLKNVLHKYDIKELQDRVAPIRLKITENNFEIQNIERDINTLKRQRL